MEIRKIFLEDDGFIPNNKLPLLLYQNAFDKRGKEGAAWLEKQFGQHHWGNAWRNGVYNYHHYHSITHEVLGVYSGSAQLQMGGEHGQKVEVKAGDVIIIPAGVAHKNLGSSSDFGVVGAYPGGSDYDLKTGKKSEQPQADKNIANVALPEADPLLGAGNGLVEIWAKIA